MNVVHIQPEFLSEKYIQPKFLSENVVDKIDSHDHVQIIESKVIAPSSTWTLYFDGPKSKEGAGAGCILIDPKGNKICISYRLYFNCTITLLNTNPYSKV